MPLATRHSNKTADGDTGIKFVTAWSVSNSHATDLTTVELEDGTGGTDVVTVKVAAGASRELSYTHPLVFNADCFVNVTGGTPSVTVSGYGD